MDLKSLLVCHVIIVMAITNEIKALKWTWKQPLEIIPKDSRPVTLVCPPNRMVQTPSAWSLETDVPGEATQEEGYGWHPKRCRIRAHGILTQEWRAHKRRPKMVEMDPARKSVHQWPNITYKNEWSHPTGNRGHPWKNKKMEAMWSMHDTKKSSRQF